MSRLHRLSAVFGMLFLSLIWGGTFAGIKSVLQSGLSVGALISIRFLLGSVFLWAIMLLLRKPFDRRSVIDGTILGLILVAIFWLQVDGLRFTTASKSGFITGLSVIFTPLVSLLLKEKFKLAHGFGALVACIGLFFLVRDPSAPFGGWNRGDSETLFCAVLCGLHITLTARMSRRSSPWVIALMQIIIVAVLSSILTTILPAHASEGQSMAGFEMLATALKRPEVWYVLLYLSILATTIGFFLQALFQSKVTATEAAIIFSTEPVFAAMLAMSGLIPGIKEHLTITQMSGGALIIVAMLLAELGPRFLARDMKSRDG
ncbi:MAG: DMT family transporter [Holophagaceae bacterium]|nr:DMT family transporter [Holophagaceae bacterium]